MKITTPLTALALLGLAMIPAHAADAATKEKPATEQASAAKKVPVYVLMVSGKG